MVSQTPGHGDSRLPDERSRRFLGEVSRGEQLGVNLIADGRPGVLTAAPENLRFGASQIKVMAGGGAATAHDPLDVTQYTADEMRAADGTRIHPGEEAAGRRRHRQGLPVGEEARREARLGHRHAVRPQPEREAGGGDPEAPQVVHRVRWRTCCW